MTPSIGRIVVFCSDDGREYAAIVTEVLADERVHLQVFVPPSGRKPYLDPEKGTPQGEPGDAGTWHWPERV